MLSGSDKGKKGKILKSFPVIGKVLVEGVNVHKKHQGPRRSDQKGQVVEKPMPVNASNVAVVDPSSGKATRVGKKLVGEKFVRIAKKSGATLGN